MGKRTITVGFSHTFRCPMGDGESLFVKPTVTLTEELEANETYDQKYNELVKAGSPLYITHLRDLVKMGKHLQEQGVSLQAVNQYLSLFQVPPHTVQKEDAPVVYGGPGGPPADPPY